MRAILIFTTALFALTASACNTQPPSPSAEPLPTGAAPTPKQASATGIKPLDQTKFGSPITQSQTTPLPAIVKDPSKFANTEVRTEGIVSAVCQTAGCWMQISDETGKAHVKMAGHAFFVPKDSSGHRAVVQGKVLPGKDDATCGDNCRERAEAQTGPSQVEIVATGVELIN